MTKIHTTFVQVTGLLCLLCLVANGTQRIYKCCDSINNQATPLNLSERILIYKNDLFFYNITTVNYSDSSNGQDQKSAVLETTLCHPDEKSLTAKFSVDTNENYQGFYSSGYLKNRDELFSPNQYCIKKSFNNGYEVKAQNSTVCNEIHCLRKCCGPLEVYDLSTYGVSKLQCVSSFNNPWRPTFYPKEEDSFSSVFFKSEQPSAWCNSANIVLWSLRRIGPDRQSLFRIMRNGSVIKKDGMVWNEMNTSSICIDGAINIPGYFDPNAKQSYFSGDEADTIIIECGPKLAEKQNHPMLLYGTALAVATVFQLATLVVYGLLWDKQNIHGWTLLGYITTMFLFYISLLATFFYLYNYPDPDFVTENEILSSFCGIIAVVTHFLYICTICWLTVISTDIFLTFRILKLTRTKSKNKMKFLIYLIFTLFVPSTIVCVGVLMDLNYGDEPDVNFILPHYGWNKCFLDLKEAAIPYLFGPIGVLLMLNFAMYLATVFHMYQLQESTKFASANSSQVQKQRAKVRMFSKLFLLMGIIWIIDVISFLASGGIANLIIIIGDVLIILQPVAIFVVFVCKKDIIKSLGEKFAFVTKVFSSFEPEESTTSSSETRGPRLTKIWNPVSTTKWFRSRINSTVTETSNLSNQSVKSINSINAIDESPELSSVPLNIEMGTTPR